MSAGYSAGHEPIVRSQRRNLPTLRGTGGDSSKGRSPELLQSLVEIRLERVSFLVRVKGKYVTGM